MELLGMKTAISEMKNAMDDVKGVLQRSRISRRYMGMNE